MALYPKILLKLSGESLAGESRFGIDKKILSRYSSEIVSVVKNGTRVAVVIGGGNLFRGLSGVESGYDRVKGDSMGMLATVINAIALSTEIIEQGVKSEVFTATAMDSFATLYSRDKVLAFMESGGVAILAGGTGNPFFTTDSASALRAAELKVDALLKGTRVDGVYNKDPEKWPDAIKYQKLGYQEALDQNLMIMDRTAFTLCSENQIPIVVFDMDSGGNLAKILAGDEVGTVIS
ncbi:MAG: UMP kinase [Bacteroidales bacterium]